jgi:penicillin amidase
MTMNDKERLRRLGDGESIQTVCEAAGITRAEFDSWWQETTEKRVPSHQGDIPVHVSTAVSIARDAHGIPHIQADNDRDLFFGFGFAMAQDRLFQLDHLRRKAHGRLAEILGPDGLETDIVARTIGHSRIAAKEWEQLSPDVRQTVTAFTDGINAHIDHCGDNLPIEFDLLDYRPQRWSVTDCIAIESEFRCYLTVRFPIIVMPELARRALGDGPLFENYLLGEADDESILHPGEYTPAATLPLEPVGQVVGDPDATTGSNNWVISGRRTTTGAPLLGSDPHIAFEAVSCWYEAHLSGGSFNVAGMAYAGMPAIMFGRNQHVAWGITNNICSQRDLYQEQTDPDHPGCFLYDGEWEPAREVTEVIDIRDAEPLTKTIRFSRNGPVVDEILPAPANTTGPVTLNWLGLHQGGWLTSLLDIDRAKTVQDFREALRPWHVPTFGLVFADTQGAIGFQSSGRIPVRKQEERGYRPGWDPEHQWQGLIPFDEMPGVIEPERGWIASANNRLAPNDFPHSLYGRWNSGWRGTRIRQMIEGQENLAPDDIRDMHQDSLNLRAASAVPHLVDLLKSDDDLRIREAIEHLQSWNFHAEPESVATAIFNVFYTHWARTVANERFDAETAELLAKGCEGFSARLLEADAVGWFATGDRETKIRTAFQVALDDLANRFGNEMSEWKWGRLHVMPLKHVLSSRGELGQLLDHGGSPVRGDMTTVCNTGSGPEWTAATGAGYRLIADLSVNPPVLNAVDAQSQSGHPGSPHYSDQFEDWGSGRYHTIPLDAEEAAKVAAATLTLQPG